MATIDAVIFDWGGTLTPWHDVPPAEAWRAVVPDPELARELAAAERTVWQRTLSDHSSGSLAEVFESVGVEPAADVLAALSRWWEPRTYLDPDVPGVFDALHAQGVRVGVLSNTLWTRAEHERIFERDGVLAAIDGAVYSSEIPWTKPHPEAFRAAMAAVGVDDPGRAVFVGDRPFEDIHGSSAVGMRSVLVPHSRIPLDQRGHVEGRPDAVIRRLAELPAVVESWSP